jgi:hypothetical protein
MRRTAAIVLLALVGILPAVDAVACPDGCTDATHSAPSWEAAAVCSQAPGCGLCLNAQFVHRHESILIRIERALPLSILIAPRPVSLAPPSLDRPPRAHLA